ncbi:PilN domain-containing protein [Acidisoma sp. L85]|uniref:PilN domain-containing protein n=1 Tax=Acidisoma sp. L85 TaxID=1641850 RepID=UPI00131BFF76|nr:PilN domain-containing protein [Acidisoma sp. L85]
MADTIFTWWAQQMRSLVPAPLASRGGWRSVVILEPTEEPEATSFGAGGFRLSLRRRGRETGIGYFACSPEGLAAARRACGTTRRRRNILLRLPNGRILEHRLTVPATAEAHIGRVLAYEIDRVTPFSESEVFWDWVIEHRDRNRSRLLVRLFLIPRAALIVLRTELEKARLHLAAVEGHGFYGDLRRLPLSVRTPARQRLERPVLRCTVGACAALVIVALVLPFVRQQLRLDRLDQRVAELQPKVSEVRLLRKRIAGQAAGSEVFEAEEAEVGRPLDAIATITKVLPDNTFLTALNLSQRSLGLTGQSGDAAALIAALSRDTEIHTPSFAAPVMTAPSGSGSLFVIRAELVPQQ